MVLQQYKIDVISDLVFIILGPFLKIINVDGLILINIQNFKLIIMDLLSLVH